MRPAPLAALLVALAPVPVVAAPAGLAVPETETQIFGGTETEQCAWPTVAYLSTDGAACTGALVHPQIVLTAAHCVPGDATATVRFGERASTATQLVDTEFCRANPNFFDTGSGTDYGFCKLAEPITNIPVIPIAFGCEESVLGNGTDVTHVGFGVDENGDSGRKKFVSLDVLDVGGGEIVTGSNGEGICSGDSGGPVFTKLSANLGGDDTWRVIGIHSWAQMASPGDCDGVAGSTIAWNAVDFIEQESGIDITPCFTSDGDWSPTWGCQEFPENPGIGGEGSYNLMCETGPLGGFSEVCGAPLTDFPDTDAPLLDVVSPQGDQVFEVDGGQAELHIEANADDGDGWGVAGVELIIAPEEGDMVSQSLAYPPYRWNTKFPVGGYNLKLIATDNAGNVTESEWIAVGVGAAPPDNPPGEDETGGDDEADTGAVDDTGGADEADDDDDGDDDDDDDDGDDGTDGGEPGVDRGDASGCACSSGDRTAAPWMLFGVVLGLVARRRSQCST